MLFKELLEKNKNFIPSIGNSEKAKEIRDQSSRHATRRGDLSILDIIRPGQSKSINEYLKTIYRNVTEQLYDKIVTESNTIFNNSGFDWAYPDILLDHYSKFKIQNGKSNIDFIKWLRLYFVNIAFTDPNAILISVPKLINGIIPNELPENQEIEFEDKLLKSDEYSFINGVLIYKYSEDIVNKTVITKYMAIDNQSYTLYYNSGNKSESIILYNHKLNYIPCVELPSKQIEYYSKDIINNTNIKSTYNESFIQGVFELLDKALLSSNDSDASQIHHAYPKLVLPEIKCVTCSGQGKIKGNTCTECNGSGHVYNFSPVSAISIPTGFDQTKNIQPGYISAPTDSLKHLFEVWQIYLNIAANSVGVDPYIHLQESGEAMKMRMQTLEKFLLNLGNAVADCIENHWNNLIRLKNPKEEFSKLKYFIKRPKKILLRNDSTIKDDINNSSGAERIEYAKEYNEYKTNDERIKRAFSIYYKIYPFAALDTTEKQFAISNGLIEREKLKESYYALAILKEILTEENPEIEENKLIEEMNKRLISLTSSNKISEFVS